MQGQKPRAVRNMTRFLCIPVRNVDHIIILMQF